MYTVVRIMHTIKHNLIEKKKIRSLSVYTFFILIKITYKNTVLARNSICDYFANSTEISFH